MPLDGSAYIAAERSMARGRLLPKREKPNAEKQRRVDIVADEHAVILAPFEVFYIQSILYAARAAGDAFERFAKAVVSEEEAIVTVSAVQEALTHAAALSRFFWPASKHKISMARAMKLRNAFKMEGSGLEQRDLRNALEHFDERLDDFLLGDPVGYFFPGPLVDPHSLADEAPGQIFRMVDPYSFIFVILGKKYEFLPIWNEVHRVLALSESFDKNGSRLRS